MEANRLFWSNHDVFSGPKRKCQRCKKIQKRTEFYIDPDRQDGLVIYCISCEKKRHRKRRIRNPANTIFITARRRARKNNTPFTIELKDILVPRYCPILGLKLKSNVGRPQDNSFSLDRIDNTKGYTPANVYVISWRANKLKGDATIAELKKIVAYMEA